MAFAKSKLKPAKEALVPVKRAWWLVKEALVSVKRAWWLVKQALVPVKRARRSG
jgi:hypothetical protein